MSRRHVIKPGEGIESLADENGLFSGTVWDDPGNAELRALRGSPFVLAAGDEVVIPDKREKTVTIGTGRRHEFKRRGVPVKFRLRLVDEDEAPRVEVRYRLDVDGVVHEGETNDDGWVEAWIPPRADKARLEIVGTDEAHDIALGHLDPVALESGVRARLHNLRILGDVNGSAEDLTAAVERFQRMAKIAATGVVDDEVRRLLVEAHGS